MHTLYFPRSMMNYPLWTLRKGKIPYSAKYPGKAKSNDPSTWSTFAEARQVLQSSADQYDGLSIATSKDHRLIFIDIDHCINDGALSDIAVDIIDRCRDQYVEISQSGTGIHILALGEIPKSFKNSSAGVEMYSESRFCALTGNALIASEPHDNPEAIDYIYHKYKTPERACFEPYSISRERLLSDEQTILDKANKDKKFSLLYSGMWESAGYRSRSEADFAFCIKLAFWTDRDPDMMDSIFRSSGLFRDKWNRRDYREKTINNAIGSIRETYSEYIDRKQSEKRRNYKNAFIEKW